MSTLTNLDAARRDPQVAATLAAARDPYANSLREELPTADSFVRVDVTSNDRRPR